MAEMGRPRLQFDYPEVEKLASLQCTDAELATWYGCSARTITDRKKNDKDFLRAYEKGREKGKLSLRRWQFQAAEKGSTAMLIWLGKQYLGQVEKHDITSDGQAFKFTMKLGDDSVDRD